jgi:hypothetical protein
VFHFPRHLLFETVCALVNIYRVTLKVNVETHQNWRPKVTALHCVVVMLVYVDDNVHYDNDNGT